MLCEMGAKFTDCCRANTVNAIQIAVLGAAQVLGCAHTGCKQGFGNGDIHTRGTNPAKEFLNSLSVCCEHLRSL